MNHKLTKATTKAFHFIPVQADDGPSFNADVYRCSCGLVNVFAQDTSFKGIVCAAATTKPMSPTRLRGVLRVPGKSIPLDMDAIRAMRVFDDFGVGPSLTLVFTDEAARDQVVYGIETAPISDPVVARALWEKRERDELIGEAP